MLYTDQRALCPTLMRVALVTTLVMVTSNLAQVPSAGAETDPLLTEAIMSGRAGSQCATLTYNPIVEHAAEIVNRTSLRFLDHTADSNPADPAQSATIVKELGIDSPKITTLQGAGHANSDAIKGILLEGRDAIPDCGYTDLGVSHLYEPGTDFHLVVAILVGK